MQGSGVGVSMVGWKSEHQDGGKDGQLDGEKDGRPGLDGEKDGQLEDGRDGRLGSVVEALTQVGKPPVSEPWSKHSAHCI